jgi:uncharacterized protein with HEPN domain
MDKATTYELLDFILESISHVKRRFKNIKNSDDFIDTNDGLDKLDAISMRLQSMGEALKNLDKRERELLLSVASKEYWSRIIKARDYLSHHYIDIDAEVVFDICSEELDNLEANILKLKNSI